MNIDDKALTVRQSNSLINASYRIASVGEGRLIRALIAQISSSDEDFKLYRVSVANFARLFNITGEAAYEQIKKAADELLDRKIFIENGEGWLNTRWLSSARYKKNSGHIELRFDVNLKPYLLQLKGYFTQYELENVVSFKSSYAIRLYELLKTEQFKAKYNGQFKRIFEYSEIRLLMGMNEYEYAFFKDFRVRVIDPAVREINASSNLAIVQVDYPKTGRKITHIVFHCEPARQTHLSVDEPPLALEVVEKPQAIPEDVRDLVAMGIDEGTAYKWRKKYGVKRLTRNLAYTRAMQKAGKIRDSLTGFLARAIADNLGSAWEEEHREKQERQKAHEEAQAAKEAIERKKSEAQRAWIEFTLARFATQSDDRKTELRKAYAATLSDITRKSFDKDHEHAPMHRMKFAQFFEAQEKQ